MLDIILWNIVLNKMGVKVGLRCGLALGEEQDAQSTHQFNQTTSL